MRCETCHGIGILFASVTHEPPYVPLRREAGGRVIAEIGPPTGYPCPDCGGCGIAHCCDGLRAQEGPEPMADDPITIFTLARVPPELARAWLQHLRDFDTAHPGCHFEVLADTPFQSLAEAVEMIKVNPGLSFTEIIERKRGGDFG